MKNRTRMNVIHEWGNSKSLNTQLLKLHKSCVCLACVRSNGAVELNRLKHPRKIKHFTLAAIKIERAREREREKETETEREQKERARANEKKRKREKEKGRTAHNVVIRIVSAMRPLLFDFVRQTFWQANTFYSIIYSPSNGTGWKIDANV